MGTVVRWNFGAFVLSLALGALVFPLNPVVAKDLTWGAILNPLQRYQLLQNFNNEAVLDRETGLIWERCPDLVSEYPWGDPNRTASIFGTCYSKVVGGRAGWRVPSVEELKSLGDPANTPFLPNSAPFCDMNFGGGGLFEMTFWTATTSPMGAGLAYKVGAGNPVSIITGGKTFEDRVWCVRGGRGHDPQH